MISILFWSSHDPSIGKKWFDCGSRGIMRTTSVPNVRDIYVG